MTAPTRSTSSRSLSFPAHIRRSVTAPTLVIDSQGSTGELAGMSAAVVEGLPNGTQRSLAGEWRGVPDDALAPVLTEFFRR